MKKSLENFVSKLQESKSRQLVGGFNVFKNIRGGSVSTNSATCVNSGSCDTSNNTGYCTNTDWCDESTNKLHCSNQQCPW